MLRLWCKAWRKVTRRRYKTDAPEILMLHDYCFHHILQFISLPDLANFKESCCLFTAVANMQFLYRTRGTLGFGVREKDIDIKYCLQLTQQFGKCVTRLTIVCEELQGMKWSEILAAVNQHCCTLEEIVLWGAACYLLTKTDVVIFRDLIISRARSLRSIELGSNCNEYNYAGLFSSHCNIATSVRYASKFEYKIDPTKDIYPDVRVSWFSYSSDRHLQCMVNSLATRWVTRFSLHNFTTTERINVSRILRLKYLTRVAIYCYNSNVDIVTFLQKLQKKNASTSIKVLHLLSPKLNEAIVTALAQITCLKILKLENGYFTTQSHFESLSLLCANPNFEHLIVLSYYQPIDKIKYLKLVEERQKSIEAMLTDNFLRWILPPERRRLYLALRDKVYTASLKLIPAELLQADETTIKLLSKQDHEKEYLETFEVF